MKLSIRIEEFGLAKVFDQSTKFHKTEHLVLSRMPFTEIIIRVFFAHGQAFHCKPRQQGCVLPKGRSSTANSGTKLQLYQG